MNDYDDDIPSDIRADLNKEAARRDNAYHWCSDCWGRTGPGSPCRPEQPETEPEE